MVLQETPICKFEFQAPEFSLLGIDGDHYTLNTIKGINGTLVMFICNHCPYVKAIQERLVNDVKALQNLGIGVIAIMSNNPDEYAEDSLENMRVISKQKGFTFPYAYDETQIVAKAYGAICTPDFFGFNANLRLQYRGRLDSSEKTSDPGKVRKDLFEAMKKIAKTGVGPTNQIPSIGCSIKWR